MPHLLLLAALLGLLCTAELSTLHAQTMMQIPPHYSSYTGYVRGYWFIAPTDFYILGVRVPTDASTAQQSIEILRIATPPPVYATCTTNLVSLGYWPNEPGTAIIPTKILVRQGEVIGIFGARWTTSGYFNSINSYTASGDYTTSILGQTTVLHRFLFQDGIMYQHADCVSDNSPGQLGRVEMYYGPPCEVPDGNLFVSLVDAAGQSTAFAEIPGNVYVKYMVSYPAGASDVGITLDFYLVGSGNPNPEFSVQLHDTKLNGQTLVGQQMVSIPATAPPGYYTIVPTVNSKNSCDEYQDTELDALTFMLVYPGTTPCEVWPGDVNNDGLVNYGDRKGLTEYIHQANLNTLWLNGPARYRSDAGANPLSYLAWEAQAAVPWYTPNGCYMDTDGNGTINNFDFIAIKMNWMKFHGIGGGKAGVPVRNSFLLSQNFPNPFNPTTRLTYTLPEKSYVRIIVTDILGREVATLVETTLATGTYIADFDAVNLPSGVYMAVATMYGQESNTSHTETVRMTLSK